MVPFFLSFLSHPSFLANILCITGCHPLVNSGHQYNSCLGVDGICLCISSQKGLQNFFCCGCNHNKAKWFWETPLLLDLPYIVFFGLFIFFFSFSLVFYLPFFLSFPIFFLSVSCPITLFLYTHTFIGKKVHVKNFQKKTETISLVTTKSKWKWQTDWLQSIDW